MSDPIELRNEFASVTVELVHTRNGERLRIFSSRLGREILLDPVELESLTWQDHALFTSFLQQALLAEEDGDG